MLKILKNTLSLLTTYCSDDTILQFAPMLDLHHVSDMDMCNGIRGQTQV